jgi:hypothetical protein
MHVSTVIQVLQWSFLDRKPTCWLHAAPVAAILFPLDFQYFLTIFREGSFQFTVNQIRAGK